jgi:flavorubredoxin
MHPMMQHLCHELEVSTPKNKVYGLFGSCSWNGGGVRSLQEFASKMGWEEAAAPVEVMGAPTLDKMSPCDLLAQSLSVKIKT